MRIFHYRQAFSMFPLEIAGFVCVCLLPATCSVVLEHFSFYAFSVFSALTTGVVIDCE
jgi:bacteriorhodopsin